MPNIHRQTYPQPHVNGTDTQRHRHSLTHKHMHEGPNIQQLPQLDGKWLIHCGETGIFTGSGPSEVEASSSGLTTRLRHTDSPLLPHRGDTTAMQSRETKLTKCHCLENP